MAQSTGAAPENAAAVAKGQAAAADAPTVAAGDAPQEQTVVTTADSTTTDVEPVGNAAAVDVATVEAEDAVDPDAVGGVSFDYGQTDADTVGVTADAVLAQAVDAYDSSLRQGNPTKIVFREAGSAGNIGGESFDYGQKPVKATVSEEGF